jgi:hypothetical protein
VRLLRKDEEIAMSTIQHWTLEMRCGCGALLKAEVPTDYSWSSSLVELAKAWNAAHRLHHEEPKKAEQPR